MQKFKRLIVLVVTICVLGIVLCACGDKYRTDLSTDENVKYDMVQVLSSVRVADGFFATYASVIPSVFVEGKWEIDYETTEVDGEELYVAIISGEYYPDYRDHESTKTGTIKFLMDLKAEKKNQRYKAPWPYEDPDGIDDIIWRFVTHKDISSR